LLQLARLAPPPSAAPRRRPQRAPSPVLPARVCPRSPVPIESLAPLRLQCFLARRVLHSVSSQLSSRLRLCSSPRQAQQLRQARSSRLSCSHVCSSEQPHSSFYPRAASWLNAPRCAAAPHTT